MKAEKTITLKTSSDILDYDFIKVNLISLKLRKIVKRNEFHLPACCFVIVNTGSKIYKLLLMYPIITSDNDGNIVINTDEELEKVLMKKPYFSTQEFEKAKALKKFYDAKRNLQLDPDEVIEYKWASDLVYMHELSNRTNISIEIEGSE